MNYDDNVEYQMLRNDVITMMLNDDNTLFEATGANAFCGCDPYTEEGITNELRWAVQEGNPTEVGRVILKMATMYFDNDYRVDEKTQELYREIYGS